MKKIVLAGALLATMGIGAFSVYADSGSVDAFDQEYNHMSNNSIQRNRRNSDREVLTEVEKNDLQAEREEFREERIQLALDEGWITEEEATQRRNEFAESDRLYEENGFSNRGYHHGHMRKGDRQNRSYHCH